MKPAFANMLSGAVLVQVVLYNIRPERPAEVTDVIWALLERCWEDDPNARPSARLVGLVLDLTYGCALNDSDACSVSKILNGTWDEITPRHECSHPSDSSLPYGCKWLHCPRSFATMQQCIVHECAELAWRRIGTS